MKKHFPSRLGLALLAVGSLALASCNKRTDASPAPASAAPAGITYSTLRQGTVSAQGGVSSGGGVALVKGSDGNEYVQFKTDFHSDFHTGSLGIYLAKSSDLIKNQRAADPASVVRVGTITQSGAQQLAVAGMSAGFSHLILHCDAAQYNFGAATLQ
ncbi:hypothetical protein ACFP2F_15225 [Hymenobacter artigasi]|uniref:DM13 domain-containing protein n=1 Tax=Hymenobacter artigasi TaxID=2719616 RepID=A0ABX1HPR2_9BACT|nr:hypothetical protein [Hymenobacter artigasi]NKI91072.1 hypothetical protein [Hymenobacter artigasi]